MSVEPQPPKFRAVAPGAVRVDGEAWGDALIGGRCRDCGTVTFTRRTICPTCWKTDTQDAVELSRRGTFYAHTIVRNPPPGAAGPYAIAYVDLPENLRIMVRSDLETVARLAPGAEVAIAIAPLGTDEDGATLLGPVLRRPEGA